MLEIKVCKIEGECPVYKVGYRMIIDGAKILPDRTDAICIHALSTLLHYVVAIDEGAKSVKSWVYPRIRHMPIYSMLTLVSLTPKVGR